MHEAILQEAVRRGDRAAVLPIDCIDTLKLDVKDIQASSFYGTARSEERRVGKECW